MNILRKHWRKISTGVLLAALIGAGGMKVRSYFFCDDGCEECSKGSSGVARR